MIRRAGLRCVDSIDAITSNYGPGSGMLIPYFDSDGTPLQDGGSSFCRLRLDPPIEDKKYHQNSGTSVHAYLPPNLFGQAKLQAPLWVIEGEKKALALADEGYNAVGISGFYGFRSPDDGAIVSELYDIINRLDVIDIVFAGDRDVLFNAQFADAACRFKSCLTTVFPGTLPRLLCWCVPPDAPGKGIDDCRDNLDGSFQQWLQEDLGDLLVDVDEEIGFGDLSIRLLTKHENGLIQLKESDSGKLQSEFARLAAGLNSKPISREQVYEVAEKLNLKRRPIQQEAKEHLKRSGTKAFRESLKDRTSKEINLDHQASEWTRNLLLALRDETFIYGSKLVREDSRILIPFTEEALVSFADSPDRCHFVKDCATGGVRKANFTLSDARVALAAATDHHEHLRPVKVVSSTPVIVEHPEPTIVSSYSRDHEILSTGAVYDFGGHTDLAAAAIGKVLRDFAFLDAVAKARALAYLITPALLRGGLLEGARAPLFGILKDQKSAGAGTLVQLCHAIYGEKPRPSSPADYKAAKEDLSHALNEGANMVYFDNLRGSVAKTLAFLESFLTEPTFVCRALYSQNRLDVTRVLIALTSNGCTLSPDLASRTIRVSLRKQQTGYDFHHWPEGNLLKHVDANRSWYLGAIFELVKAWLKEGRPSGSKSGFRFPEWEGGLSWIIGNGFPQSPLMFDPKQCPEDEEIRLSSTKYTLLRSLFHLVRQGRDPFAWRTATELADIAVEAGHRSAEPAVVAREIGIAMKEVFRDGRNEVTLEADLVIVREEYHDKSTDYEQRKHYALRPAAENETPQGAPPPPASRTK